jgi:exodeoxyribonuclease VII large subunit
MQGEQTASSIMAALDLIFEYEASFDLVAIIRGGGAKTDLIAFDDYELASYIAQFPLPIITGIGHERDESIADLVAHTSLKTPTAVAEFMLTLMLQKLNEYTNAAENLKTTINQYFEVRNQKLAQIHVRFKPVVLRQIDQNQFKISTLANRLRISSQNHFEAKKQTIHRLATTVQTRAQLQISVQTHHISLLSSKLQHNSQANISQKCTNVAALERALVHLNPYNILGRGFTATFIDGKLIASVKDLKKGRVIVTRFVDGELTSQIISARENNTED